MGKWAARLSGRARRAGGRQGLFWPSRPPPHACAMVANGGHGADCQPTMKTARAGGAPRSRSRGCRLRLKRPERGTSLLLRQQALQGGAHGVERRRAAQLRVDQMRNKLCVQVRVVCRAWRAWGRRWNQEAAGAGLPGTRRRRQQQQAPRTRRTLRRQCGARAHPARAATRCQRPRRASRPAGPAPAAGRPLLRRRGPGPAR